MSSHINTVDRADGDDRETRQLYAAMQKDAEEDNIPPKDILQSYSAYYYAAIELQINYHVFQPASRGYYGGSRSVYLSPSMTNTIDALIEMGYLEKEDIEQWKQDREAARTEAEMEKAAWAEQHLVSSESGD